MLHTRNEGDDNGSGLEVIGLLLSLGFRVRSSWAEGRDLNRLKAAGLCEYTIGLPHARPFASQLAAAAGSQLVEAPLPLGLSGTSEFLRAVGRATDISPEVEHLIDLEVRRCTKALDNVISLLADEISVAVLADPVAAPALHLALTEVGIDVPLTGVLTSRPLPEEVATLSGRVVADPSFPAWEEALLDAATSGVQLVVGSGLSEVAAHKAGVELIEVGFPCQNTHYLTPTPLLGYQGFLSLVERIANAYCQRVSRNRLDSAAKTLPK